MIFVADGSIRSAGIIWSANGSPVLRILRVNLRCRENRPRAWPAWARRRSSATVDGLVVRPLVVAVEEQLVAEQRSAEARAPPMLVRVGVRIVSRDARQRLVVRQRVQSVAVEIVEAGAAILQAPALGRHDDACQTAVLRAVRVRQHLDFRDGVEARCRVADRAEDRVGRRLAVLDVRHAVGLGARGTACRRCRRRRWGSAG